jgi:hypothetical protein
VLGRHASLTYSPPTAYRDVEARIGKYQPHIARAAARAALAAWAVHLDQDERGLLAECRRRADPALRERLAGQWRALTEGQIRGRYPQVPPDIPTCQLRADGDAPPSVPRRAVRCACLHLPGLHPHTGLDDLPARRTPASGGRPPLTTISRAASGNLAAPGPVPGPSPEPGCCRT